MEFKFKLAKAAKVIRLIMFLYWESICSLTRWWLCRNFRFLGIAKNLKSSPGSVAWKCDLCGKAGQGDASTYFALEEVEHFLDFRCKGSLQPYHYTPLAFQLTDRAVAVFSQNSTIPGPSGSTGPTGLPGPSDLTGPTGAAGGRSFTQDTTYLSHEANRQSRAMAASNPNSIVHITRKGKWFQEMLIGEVGEGR